MELELTQDLIDEGVVRELSRFLNQMRKDADLRIDHRIKCSALTTDESMTALITTTQRNQFLCNEALLAELESTHTLPADTTHQDTFSYEGADVTFSFH
jgi:hypothetical protein